MNPNRKRTVDMWTRDPHCHWCGRVTVLQKTGQTGTSAETATTDHLYSRVHPHRDDFVGQPVVLACFECNQARNLLEMAERKIKQQPQNTGGILHRLMTWFKNHPQSLGCV
jgi:hypothetical protein